MAILYKVSLLAAHTCLAYASPMIEEQLSAAGTNRTTLKSTTASPWVAGPDTRGTSDILWACIVTLTACIYTAVHLNVPPWHEGNWQFILHKMKWVALALFAPESVVFVAYSQFMKARKLVKELNELQIAQGYMGDSQLVKKVASEGLSKEAKGGIGRPSSPNMDVEKDQHPEKPSPKKFPLEYGFFVVMGGIVTQDIAKLTNVSIPRTLGPEAILIFARRGVFFDVSSDMILDKSKANLFGKLLICVQVLWFAIQIIARAAARYPISLLEVHTMVHVICALVMYMLWWKKPQDVSEPVSQDTSGHLDILASLLVMSHPDSRKREANNLTYYGTRDVQLQSPDVEAAHKQENGEYNQIIIFDKSSPQCQMVLPPRPEGNDICALFEGQALRSLVGPRSRTHPPNEILKPTYLSGKDVLRWNCLAGFLRRPEMREVVQKTASQRKRNVDTQDHDAGTSIAKLLKSIDPSYTARSLFVPHQPNIAIQEYDSPTRALLNIYSIFDTGPWSIWVMLGFLPIVYGGIHLAAWDFQFASYTERLLWRIACIDIMATTLSGNMIIVPSTEVLNNLKSCFPKCACLDWAIAFLYKIVPLGLLVLCTLSRTYLVVESFVSLRHVPVGVYTAVPWVQSIPHL